LTKLKRVVGEELWVVGFPSSGGVPERRGGLTPIAPPERYIFFV